MALRRQRVALGDREAKGGGCGGGHPPYRPGGHVGDRLGMPLTPPSTLGRETLEHVVSTDGTPIAVWRSGDGPPLVLVHGATADHSRWAPVLPALQERFTVLAIDRRGRGRSGDAATYAIEREYEDVAAVVEWAGEHVSVLGHSYGGVCALEAARLTDRHRPARALRGAGRLRADPARMSSIASRRCWTPASATSCSRCSCARSPAFRASRSSCCGRCRPGRRGSPPPTRSPARSSPTGSTSSTPIASGRCTCRRCCSQAATAPTAFRAADQALQAALPDSRIAVMPGQRHAAMDTGTDLFLAEVLSFLAPTSHRRPRAQDRLP